MQNSEKDKGMKTQQIIFICIDDNEEERKVLCYDPTLNRTRIYRQGVGSIARGLKVKEYRSAKNAQSLCDEINRRSGGNYKPIQK